MFDDMNIESLRAMARRAGLRLSDEELQRLLPGVNRARKQAFELREIVIDKDEPAGTFAASKLGQK